MIQSGAHKQTLMAKMILQFFRLEELNASFPNELSKTGDYESF